MGVYTFRGCTTNVEPYLACHAAPNLAASFLASPRLTKTELICRPADLHPSPPAVEKYLPQRAGFFPSHCLSIVIKDDLVRPSRAFRAAKGQKIPGTYSLLLSSQAVISD